MASLLRARVTGLVQGVGFRYFVLRRAQESGVTGWVRNMPDDSVELEAMGEREKLEILLAAVRNGPRSAIVRDVTVEWGESGQAFTSFEIR